MGFRVRSDRVPTTSGLDGAVVVLESEDGTARADIWPAGGFNAYRWILRQGERVLDLLFADPTFLVGGRPSASGNPILFPFPNRIAQGKFSWEGRDFALPATDGPGIHAIHGFALNRSWRVIEQGADARSAWVTGEFHLSREAADVRSLWPADACLRLTYRLNSRCLRFEALVTNPDTVPLPFGLGYHPYFRVPLAPNTAASEVHVQALAAAQWELQDFLPSGRRLPVQGDHDLRSERPFASLKLDDVYTELMGDVDAQGLRLMGVLRQSSMHAALRVKASPDFRELVLYTPGHRQAVCLEPYTCTTDAINLQRRGIEAGWRVLPPGGAWAGNVELEVVL